MQILGRIIQKMTQILIMDRYQSNQKKNMETMRNNFIFSWLFASEDGDETEESIKLRGQLLRIDVDLDRIVVVCGVIRNNENFREWTTNEEQQLVERAITEIKRCLKSDEAHLITQIGSKIIIFFHSSDITEVLKMVRQIVKNVEKQYDCKTYCGIGTEGKNRLEIRRSYREADTAYNLAVRLKNENIKIYSDVDLELLLENIPHHDRELFVKRIFRDCDENEIDGWMDLLRCYTENNGSITKTADVLFIHKNTLQYRLFKMKEVTGYDPRNIKEAIPLYISMLIRELDRNR